MRGGLLDLDSFGFRSEALQRNYRDKYGEEWQPAPFLASSEIEDIVWDALKSDSAKGGLPFLSGVFGDYKLFAFLHPELEEQFQEHWTLPIEDPSRTIQMIENTLSYRLNFAVFVQGAMLSSYCFKNPTPMVWVDGCRLSLDYITMMDEEYWLDRYEDEGYTLGRYHHSRWQFANWIQEQHVTPAELRPDQFEQAITPYMRLKWKEDPAFDENTDPTEEWIQESFYSSFSGADISETYRAYKRSNL